MKGKKKTYPIILHIYIYIYITNIVFIKCYFYNIISSFSIEFFLKLKSTFCFCIICEVSVAKIKVHIKLGLALRTFHAQSLIFFSFLLFFVCAGNKEKDVLIIV